MSRNYWRDLYGGERSRDFIEGVMAGVEVLAVWKNAVQVVGAYDTPLDIEISEIKKGLGWKEKWDK